MMTTGRSLTLCAFVLFACVAVGCSEPSLAPCRVSGSVNYKGQSIQAGAVSFFTTDGVAYSSAIKDDGTYSISDVPAGEFVVVVETESKKPKTAAAGKDDAFRRQMQGKTVQQRPGGDGGGGGGAPPPKEVYTKIPDKYGKKETSPLTAKLTAGRNVYNIDLTD